jgi:chromate transport protein ChrA
MALTPTETTSGLMRGTHMERAHVGLLVGLLLGLALVLTSFGEMLIVALAALIGWVVVRVVDGDVDLGELVNRGQRRR